MHVHSFTAEIPLEIALDLGNPGAERKAERKKKKSTIGLPAGPANATRKGVEPSQRHRAQPRAGRGRPEFAPVGLRQVAAQGAGKRAPERGKTEKLAENARAAKCEKKKRPLSKPKSDGRMFVFVFVFYEKRRAVQTRPSLTASLPRQQAAEARGARTSLRRQPAAAQGRITIRDSHQEARPRRTDSTPRWPERLHRARAPGRGP